MLIVRPAKTAAAVNTVNQAAPAGYANLQRKNGTYRAACLLAHYLNNRNVTFCSTWQLPAGERWTVSISLNPKHDK
jgi:hypothetical protein